MSTTGDDLAISGPGEVGGSWSSIKPKGVSEVSFFQHSSGLVWGEAVASYTGGAEWKRSLTLTVIELAAIISISSSAHLSVYTAIQSC